MFLAVVTTTNSGAVKIRAAAFRATAARRTLASAATISGRGELTFNVLFGDALCVQLLRDAGRQLQKELAAKLQRQFLRIAKRIEDRRRFPVARDEHGLILVDQLGDAGAEVAKRCRFHAAHAIVTRLLDAVIPLLMLAIHWGLFASRNATRLT